MKASLVVLEQPPARVSSHQAILPSISSCLPMVGSSPRMAYSPPGPAYSPQASSGVAGAPSAVKEAHRPRRREEWAEAAGDQRDGSTPYLGRIGA